MEDTIESTVKVQCNKIGTTECPEPNCYCAKPHEYDYFWCDATPCDRATGGHAHGHECIPVSTIIKQEE